MPLYEYECTACLKHTEKIQKFSDPEITICPYCGGTLKRVITAPAIAFKGGGWYADGYGNAKPAASGESKNGEGKSSDGKSSEGKDGDSKGSDSKSDGAAATSSATETKSSGGSEGSGAIPAAPAPAPSTPANTSSSASDKK